MSQRLPDLERRLRKCTGVLVDSNVLLDLSTNDPLWADWSANALADCGDRAELVINPIIYAEVSASYQTIEKLDSALPLSSYVRRNLPWEAAFLASKAFLNYRQRGGVRTAPMPDFYIGAHAAVERLAILTRDAARYRTYFPTLEVIAP